MKSLTLRFASMVVLIATVVFVIGFFGIRVWACDTGCNRGFGDYCFGMTGEVGCLSHQICEVDRCLATDCWNEYNYYQFCVGYEYLCQIPACDWISECCG
jgi:hypothetical protein